MLHLYVPNLNPTPEMLVRQRVVTYSLITAIAILAPVYTIEVVDKSTNTSFTVTDDNSVSISDCECS
jgi:hypothetical protein